MPKPRTRAEAAAYMREYRARKRADATTGAPVDVQDLAALESPDAAWRRMHPSAALVELARSLPDMEPDDGADFIPPHSGALAAPDARWRQFAPRIAFGSLSANIAATLTPEYAYSGAK